MYHSGWQANWIPPLWHYTDGIQWIKHYKIWRPRHCNWMDTHGPSVLKASPDQMVCSRQSWTSHTWPSLLIKTGNCPAELYGPNSPADVTHPAHQRSLQQNMLRSGSASLLHSTSLKTHQGLSWLVWGYWSIPWNLSHHSPWWCQTCGICTQKVSDCNATPSAWETQWVHQPRYYHFSWKAYWLGLYTWLLLEGKWETMSLSGPQRILIQLLDVITTKSLLWKRTPMNWLEASASPSSMEPHPSCA